MLNNGKGKLSMRSKKGFTLAEVLVTLAVIGVVAALTIPALISNSTERQARTSVKKALSILNQALTMSIAQNGLDTTCSTCGTSEGLKGLFANYLSVMSSDTTNHSITTADGMIYTFLSTGVCPTTITNNDPTNASAICMIEVDINGNKGSSVIGQVDGRNAADTHGAWNDLYYFVVLKNQIVPANDSTNAYHPKGGTFRATTNLIPGGAAVSAITD